MIETKKCIKIFAQEFLNTFTTDKRQKLEHLKYLRANIEQLYDNGVYIEVIDELMKELAIQIHWDDMGI